MTINDQRKKSGIIVPYKKDWQEHLAWFRYFDGLVIYVYFLTIIDNIVQKQRLCSYKIYFFTTAKDSDNYLAQGFMYLYCISYDISLSLYESNQ